MFNFQLLFSLAFETPKHSAIVMEYVSGGELFDYVQKKEGMNETSAQEMFINVVHGVQHCHRKGVAHRDLKLENILLDKDHQPKVTWLLFHLLQYSHDHAYLYLSLLCVYR